MSDIREDDENEGQDAETVDEQELLDDDFLDGDPAD